jgi:hypothetical protein
MISFIRLSRVTCALLKTDAIVEPACNWLKISFKTKLILETVGECIHFNLRNSINFLKVIVALVQDNSLETAEPLQQLFRISATYFPDLAQVL